MLANILWLIVIDRIYLSLAPKELGAFQTSKGFAIFNPSCDLFYGLWWSRLHVCWVPPSVISTNVNFLDRLSLIFVVDIHMKYGSEMNIFLSLRECPCRCFLTDTDVHLVPAAVVLVFVTQSVRPCFIPKLTHPNWSYVCRTLSEHGCLGNDGLKLKPANVLIWNWRIIPPSPDILIQVKTIKLMVNRYISQPNPIRIWIVLSDGWRT